ncbi:hypothetical protein Tco_1180430 [Tanacetum coccineum]
MVNEDLISKYLDTHGCFLSFLMVNHFPAILIMKNGVTKKKRAFRLSDFVAKRSNFHTTVEEVWKQVMQGYIIGDLKSIQYAMEKDPDNADLGNKSLEWLNEGDRNTSFFHKVLKERKHKIKIMAICDESGKRYENEEAADQFLKHIKEILGKEDKDKVGKEVCQAVQQFFDIGKLLGERGYNRKSSGKKCAFKIDLQKAYDTINWDFIGKSLSGFCNTPKSGLQRNVEYPRALLHRSIAQDMKTNTKRVI